MTEDHFVELDALLPLLFFEMLQYRSSDFSGVGYDRDYSCSEVGDHPNNEDAFLTSQHPSNTDIWIVVLADGQGGQRGGRKRRHWLAEPQWILQWG